MKNIIIIILLIFSIDIINCSFQSTLFSRMSKDKKGKNLIISPLGIFQSLSLTANGAKGQTQLEMLDLLQSSTIEELNNINYEIISLIQNCSTIDIANAVLTRFPPLKNFVTISQKYFAPIEPLRSLEQINNWCSNMTHGKINKILDDLDPLTVMIILNAVYFKGEWALKFETSKTKKLPFYNFGTEEIIIDTMVKIDHFKYFENKEVQAIELRFVKDYMSAIIILPAEGTDINKFIDTLSISNDEYEKIINGLNRKKVNLQLPKFELEFSENLNQILINLGMYDAFDLKNADFGGLSEEGNLYIDQVVHKTYLKIFEDGCEASSDSVVVISTNSTYIQEKIYDMKVNRPFLFLIKNSMIPKGYDLVFMSKIEKLK